jgi:hypothetical protein
MTSLLNSHRFHEIKGRANICEVWAALGGGKLRRLRGRAFWRSGDGFNVAINTRRGTWHDFVSGDGGDVIDLVRAVQACGFSEACEWLSRHTGVPFSQGNRAAAISTDTDWPIDLRWATWWKITAEMLAEWALEVLPPWHSERPGLTELLSTIRIGDAALVNEYRSGGDGFPK